MTRAVLFKKGAGLWEISAGLVLVMLLGGAVSFSAGRSVDAGRRERMVAEMTAILEAARQYDALHGAWPASWQDVCEVLPHAPVQNAWGNGYVLGADERRAWVETDVPQGTCAASPCRSGDALVVVTGMADRDRVRLSTGRRYGQAGRLAYEKRNVYVP